MRVESGALFDQLTSAEHRLRSILATSDLSTPIPDCPGWRLSDLGEHLGGIYRFATTGIAEKRPSDAPHGPTGWAALLDWFDTGFDLLCEALADHPWDEPCWTMGPDKTVGFWVRRQCHETTMHMRDAQHALGSVEPLSPELAVDGIDEVLEVFLPRQIRLGRIAPLPARVDLHITDLPGVMSGVPAAAHPAGGRTLGEGPAANAAVTGPAELVLLLLWHRVGPDAEGLTVTGSRDAVTTVFSTALTP